MLHLLHFAEWYRQIHDMPATDRPDDAVIEDDEKLDRWYHQFVIDMAREAAKLKAKRVDQRRM